MTSPSDGSILVPGLETFSKVSSSCSSRSGVRGPSSSMANSGWVMKLWMEFWFLGFWMLSWRELWNALTTLIYTRGRKRRMRKYGGKNWLVEQGTGGFEDRNKTQTTRHYCSTTKTKHMRGDHETLETSGGSNFKHWGGVGRVSNGKQLEYFKSCIKTKEKTQSKVSIPKQSTLKMKQETKRFISSFGWRARTLELGAN